MIPASVTAKGCPSVVVLVAKQVPCSAEVDKERLAVHSFLQVSESKASVRLAITALVVRGVPGSHTRSTL